jgi:hypothetical protein
MLENLGLINKEKKGKEVKIKSKVEFKNNNILF